LTKEKVGKGILKDKRIRSETRSFPNSPIYKRDKKKRSKRRTRHLPVSGYYKAVIGKRKVTERGWKKEEKRQRMSNCLRENAARGELRR